MLWWENLQNEPVIPGLLNCSGCQYIRSLGWLPRADSKGQLNERLVVNGYMEQFRALVPIPFDESAYNVIRDNHVGVVKSVMKYDRPWNPPETFRPDVWYAAMQDTMRDYEFMRGTSRVKSRGEVTLDPDTSPGPVYKWLGCRAKVDGIIDFPEIDQWLWDTGWLQNYPILWKQSGKVELVKRKKLDTNDIRGFTIAPLDLVIFASRLMQDFDEKLSRYANMHGHNPTKVGMVMQKGGFSSWGRYLDTEGWLKISEDVVKYDSTWGEFLGAMPCYEVRLMADDGSDPTFAQRLQYVYEQDIHSFVLLPSGEVVQKHVGMNSGKVATSYDGSISHTAMSHYVARRCSGLDADPDGYQAQLRNYKFGVYSDDKNSAVSPAWASKFTFERRSAAYAELGLTLDKAKDVESYTLTGHQWLGKTFDLRDGVYVPVANQTKILCSLRNLEGSVSPEIHIARALALMVEATFTEAFPWIRNYVLWLLTVIGKMPEGETSFERWLLSVPTYAQCVRFWLGTEGGGGTRPPRTRLKEHAHQEWQRRQAAQALRVNWSQCSWF